MTKTLFYLNVRWFLITKAVSRYMNLSVAHMHFQDECFMWLNLILAWLAFVSFLLPESTCCFVYWSQLHFHAEHVLIPPFMNANSSSVTSWAHTSSPRPQILLTQYVTKKPDHKYFCSWVVYKSSWRDSSDSKRETFRFFTGYFQIPRQHNMRSINNHD